VKLPSQIETTIDAGFPPAPAARAGFSRGGGGA